MTAPNQVWSADITYIRLVTGFMYLVAIIDWYSRYVLSWRLSNTLEADFCVEALEEALTLGKPGIFNTDQGAQFTGLDFTNVLLNRGSARKAATGAYTEVRENCCFVGNAADGQFLEVP